MESLDKLLGWKDILVGVGELIVDEAKVAFHAIFDQVHHDPSPEPWTPVQVDAEAYMSQIDLT